MKGVLTCVVFLVGITGYSQKAQGYFGKKYFVSFEADVYTPLMYNMVSKHEDYPKYSEDFEKAYDLINYGAKINLGYVVQNNIALSFESGIEFSDMYMYYSNTLPGYDNFVFRIPKVALRTFSFIPKIEIASKKALLPMGFSHQLGIGISETKMVDRLYECQVLTDLGQYVSLNPSYVKDHFYDFENGHGYKFLNLVYGINMRSAISKNIMFSYGVRYTFKIHLKNDVDNISGADFIFSESEVRNTIYHQQARSILSFDLGFTYVF